MAHVCCLDLRTQKNFMSVRQVHFFEKEKIKKTEDSHPLHCTYSPVKKQLSYEHIICINSSEHQPELRAFWDYPLNYIL